MRELNDTLNSMYLEIGRMQADFEVVNSEATEAWNKYKETLDSYDELIADINLALQEAKDLKEQFERKIQEPLPDGSDYRKMLYREAAFMFKEKELQLSESKKLFVSEKRNVARPDTTDKDAMLQELKSKRAEHADLTIKYRTMKEDFAKKKLTFEQAQEEYFKLRDAEEIDISKKVDQKKIDALKKANIPEEFWDDAVVDYVGTEIHIYYGGDKDHAHGHVVLRGDKETYVREPHEYSIKIG